MNAERSQTMVMATIKVLYHRRLDCPRRPCLAATLFETTDPAATTEFSPIVTPLRMTAFIPIQTLSAMQDRRGANRRARRALLVVGCESERVASTALRRIDRMKIRIGDPDVPGNQAIAADLDQLLGHEQRRHSSRVKSPTLQRPFITDARTSNRHSRRHSRQANGVVVSCCEEAKNLRGFAVKSGAEVNVRAEWDPAHQSALHATVAV